MRRRRNPERTPGDFGGMFPAKTPVRIHGLTYKLWMRAVHDIALERHGVSIYDGVDWASRDSWQAGDDPEEGYEVWCTEQADSLGIDVDEFQERY